MRQIEDSINELVKSIKNDSDLNKHCFVKGFSAAEHPNPLGGYLIAVSTLDTQVSSRFVGDNVGSNLKGSILNATVKFRVYAPKNEGGDGLLALSQTLSEAIKRCDTQNVCQDISVSGIAFDNDAMTVYRDVAAHLSFCLYEEVAI